MTDIRIWQERLVKAHYDLDLKFLKTNKLNKGNSYV